MLDSENQAPDPRQFAGEPAPPADTLLVRAVLAREAGALEPFTERMKCVPRILSALNRRIGRPLDEHDLVDVEQEALVVIWKKLPSFDGKHSLEAWAFRVCYLCLMNATRKARTRSQAVELGLNEETIVARSTPDPSQYEDVYRGLDRLPADESEVLRLKHFDELTFEEIGERLSLSPNTIKTRYYRARLHLQEILAPNREVAC